ncbi:hypothetical protein ABBQ38_003785 [Trebouxia sp. C0009 RCD-2024]
MLMRQKAKSTCTVQACNEGRSLHAETTHRLHAQGMHGLFYKGPSKAGVAVSRCETGWASAAAQVGKT